MLLYNICLQGYNTSVSFISPLWFQSFKKISCKHYFSNPNKRSVCWLRIKNTKSSTSLIESKMLASIALFTSLKANFVLNFLDVLLVSLKKKCICAVLLLPSFSAAGWQSVTNSFTWKSPSCNAHAFFLLSVGRWRGDGFLESAGTILSNSSTELIIPERAKSCFLYIKH